jgi:hypothetical protein
MSLSLIPLIDSEPTSFKGLKGLDLQGGSIIDRSRSAGLSDPSMIWVPLMLGKETLKKRTLKALDFDTNTNLRAVAI